MVSLGTSGCDLVCHHKFGQAKVLCSSKMVQIVQVPIRTVIIKNFVNSCHIDVRV